MSLYLVGDWREVSTNITVPGSETGVAIQGLQPATSYHIRIFSENEVGSSEPSEAIVANTTEEGNIFFTLLLNKA